NPGAEQATAKEGGMGSAGRRLISSGFAMEDAVGYSRAVVDGEWVYVSGTTGFDYRTMSIPADVREQAAQALDNIEAALAEAGATLADVVRVRYLLPNRADFEPCWPVLRARFDDVRPAATMMVCGLADERMLIEIEVTAHREQDREPDTTDAFSSSVHPPGAGSAR
ncbi:MAG TPA: RidA family protein, partial [Pseudonocardiaceae bacterium]